MLRVGVNYRKVNYNREEIFVHHLTDDVTGKPVPICGTDVYDLTDGGDADWLAVSIRSGGRSFHDSESDRLCSRCRRIYLLPGQEEEKSKRRLASWKRKEARRKLIETYEQKVIENWLGQCPKCQGGIATRDTHLAKQAVDVATSNGRFRYRRKLAEVL